MRQASGKCNEISSPQNRRLGPIGKLGVFVRTRGAVGGASGLCYNIGRIVQWLITSMPSSFPRLTVRDAFGNQREIEISRTPFTLGRQSDNDLVLLDSRISSRHARLLKDAQGYVLEDTDSTHGTFVNGERIVGSQRLKPGDQISLGVTDSYALAFGVEEAVLPGLLEKFERVGEQSSAPQLHHLGLLLQMAQMLLRAPALEEVLTALVDSAVQLANADRKSTRLNSSH